MYLVHTKLDICFTVSALSQFMVEPRQIHWVATKHVLKYLCGTVGYGPRYIFDGGLMLHGFTDSNWAGIAVDKKSTFGCCFSLGSTMISWFSRKQTFLALSSLEA